MLFVKLNLLKKEIKNTHSCSVVTYYNISDYYNTVVGVVIIYYYLYY